MSSKKTTMTCHCKAITIHLAEKPTVLNECLCSICRRYAVQWAYYPINQVEIVAEPNATEFYLWGDKWCEFHRCRKCGCVTHWKSTPESPQEDKMAINGRLLEKADREEIPVKQTRRNDVDFELSPQDASS